MKKILFASTALVAFAGAASAEIAISGAAEIGIVGGNRYATAANTDGVTQFWTDVEVTFTMTGEADNGLTFGATVQLDEANVPGTDDNGATWFVAYGNARLDMGDTDGALDWAMQEVALAAGTIDDTETSHWGYNGNSGFDGREDGQVARFTYTFGSFAAALSAEIDDDPNAPTNADDDTIWGVGFKYKGDLGGTKLGVGIGYQEQNDYGNIIGASVDATLASGIAFALNYSETDYEAAGLVNQKHMGVGIGYTMNALAIGLNYGKYDDFRGVNGNTSEGYALAVNYDLGGGLKVQAGYADGERKLGGVKTDYDNFSLGLAMSF
ncbi:porin [Sagittula sp. S175]|uniref:porin n=1 Tax=Sagittula sp. S175 TaxID=3415129 RepID=UPI003C7AEF51